MKDFMKVSPLNILERSSLKGLEQGHLGVLIARAGLGKTACLIHIALETIFRREKLVHVSLEEPPEKVMSYYKVIFSDLGNALNMENESEVRTLMDENRVILAYLNRSFEIRKLRENLKTLADKVSFRPCTLIVDGLDFEKAGRDIFEGFKEMATQFQVAVWFSARSHRHVIDVNQRGIPYPCNRVDDFFSIIIQLHPTPSGISLKLLKDPVNHEWPGAGVNLDPKTFLVA